jgi:hypothetical protein
LDKARFLVPACMWWRARSGGAVKAGVATAERLGLDGGEHCATLAPAGLICWSDASAMGGWAEWRWASALKQN